MEYCSAIKRNEFGSIVVRWVNLAMFFFLKMSLTIWGPFVFSYKFDNYLFWFCEKCYHYFVRDCIESVDCLG